MLVLVVYRLSATPGFYESMNLPSDWHMSVHALVFVGCGLWFGFFVDAVLSSPRAVGGLLQRHVFGHRLRVQAGLHVRTTVFVGPQVAR